ncbi:MAG TPA: amidohydrolase family protein, partial [Thermoanaerobaculia bacterium]|nr:amidohydrolase family protein [Thermoanaerobaculia bacterium]
LTQRGMPIDLASPSPEDFARYREAGADLRLTTLSGSSPLESIRTLISAGVVSVEEALPLITSNPAHILRLGQSGEIAPGRRADLLLLDRETLELRKVIRTSGR